jgi:signal transduction histidine kinase/ActR/RegA family two-component response regulator
MEIEPPTIELSQRIQDKKFSYLLSHMPQIVSANLFISLVMVAILWGTFPKYQLLCWLAAIYFVTIIRWPIGAFFLKKFQSQSKHSNSEAMFIIFSLLSGCLWGSAGIIFIDPQHTIQMTIVVLALMGMMSGAVASLSAIYSVYLAFSLMTWLPVTIHLLAIGTPEYYALGTMGAFYLIIYFGHSRQVSKLVASSISLQFDNLELIAELRQQKDLAEQANTDKSRFLAAASHDLRQPLHTLNLFVDTLNNRLTDKNNREILSYITRSVSALGELFNTLLDISKLDAGFVEANKVNIYLQPLIDKVVEDFKPIAEEKNLSLTVIKTSVVVHSDPVYIELILRNIIGNAIRHVDQGRVLIGCRRRNKNKKIAIQVLDTGPGIPANEIKKIFTEFYQLGNPERDRTKGHGLGLSIVKRLVALLGHTLDVRSHAGKGSQFSVSVTMGDALNIYVRKEASISDSIGMDLQGLKILAIDDEQAILKGLDGVVTNWGCALYCAESLLDAIPILDAQQPNILLVDYRLRENENGLQVIADLQKRHGGPLPAILITGDTGTEHLLKTKASGVFVLHKPVRPAQLRLAMTQVMQSHYNLHPSKSS